MRLSFGSAVVDGVVRYFSPTSLSMGDPDQYGGCEMRYWLRYVAKLPEGETAAKLGGTDVHDQLDRYIKTGRVVLTGAALALRPYVPEGARSEVPMRTSLTAPGLELAGVPIVGYLDVIIANAPYYLDARADAQPEQSHTVEALDWKTTGKPLHETPRGPELLGFTPMAAYGACSLIEHQDAQHVRLSHVYSSTRHTDAVKRTTSFPAEIVARRWEQLAPLGRSLLEVARETDPDKIEGHAPSCTAWRGCGYMARCPAQKKLNDKNVHDLLGGGKEMSLFKKVQESAPTTSRIAGLRAREKAAHAEQTMPAGFAEAARMVHSARDQFGTPALGAAVARAYASAVGMPEVTEGAGLAGSGSLGELAMLATPEDVIAMGKEIEAELQGPAQVTQSEPIGLLPADVPASKPELASKPPGKAGPGRPAKDSALVEALRELAVAIRETKVQS